MKRCCTRNALVDMSIPGGACSSSDLHTYLGCSAVMSTFASGFTCVPVLVTGLPSTSTFPVCRRHRNASSVKVVWVRVCQSEFQPPHRYVRGTVEVNVPC